eukprot:2312417-Amphidinium_carterae.1
MKCMKGVKYMKVAPTPFLYLFWGGQGVRARVDGQINWHQPLPLDLKWIEKPDICYSGELGAPPP